MTEFKAIIFDLGKVVFDLSFDRVFHCWSQATGLPVSDLMRNNLFDEASDQFERNEISPKEFRSASCRKLGVGMNDDDFDKGWCDLYLDLYEGTEGVLKGLRQN